MCGRSTSGQSISSGGRVAGEAARGSGGGRAGSLQSDGAHLAIPNNRACRCLGHPAWQGDEQAASFKSGFAVRLNGGGRRSIKRSPRSFVSFHRRAQPTAGSWALAFLRISGGSLKGRLHALPCFPRTVQLLVVCWQQPACPPAPPDGRKRLGRLRCCFCGHKQLLRSLRRSSQASPASALLAWAPAEASPPLPAAPPPPTARLRLAPPRLAGWAASTARMRE